MTDDKVDRDLRPKRRGWAPGNYSNLCYRCKKEFTGNKRACMCADCAYEKSQNVPP